MKFMADTFQAQHAVYLMALLTLHQYLFYAFCRSTPTRNLHRPVIRACWTQQQHNRPVTRMGYSDKDDLDSAQSERYSPELGVFFIPSESIDTSIDATAARIVDDTPSIDKRARKKKETTKFSEIGSLQSDWNEEEEKEDKQPPPNSSRGKIVSKQRSEADAFYEAYWDRKSRKLKLTPAKQREQMDKWYPRLNPTYKDEKSNIQSLLSQRNESFIDMQRKQQQQQSDETGNSVSIALITVIFLGIARVLFAQ